MKNKRILFETKNFDELKIAYKVLVSNSFYKSDMTLVKVDENKNFISYVLVAIDDTFLELEIKTIKMETENISPEDFISRHTFTADDIPF